MDPTVTYLPDPVDSVYHQTVVPAPNNMQYVIAVVAMMLIGVAGVVTIAVLRPGGDNTALNASILGFLAPTTLSLLAFMKAQETHLSVNSRLDAFMRNAEVAAHAKGLIDGRSQGRDLADARTDALAATIISTRVDAALADRAATAAAAAAHVPVQVEVVNTPLSVIPVKDGNRREPMSLIGLLIVLLIVGVVLWAARTLIAAFAIPAPIGTVIYVIIVLVCVVWLIQALGGGLETTGPLLRIR